MKKNAIVSFPKNKEINAEINLTGSKSESNRALVTSALSKGLVKVDNLSDADDTVVLNNILTQLVNRDDQLQHIDVGHAGTAMRFLTAYLSTIDGQFLLTGSKRMKERPIKLLAAALTSLGAVIKYDSIEGYPPLLITGPLIQSTRNIKIRGDISSQYLSALLIIAPTLPMGLSLEIEGPLTSKPYVDMTLKMLEETGIKHVWLDNTITIAPQKHTESVLTVEPDWSAASYWYSIASLADLATITLPNLKETSLQGDSRIHEIMLPLGVKTIRKGNGFQLTKTLENSQQQEVLNLKDCPDLAQTIIVAAAAKGLNLAFTGLETLKIKETDRIKALQNELAKIGVALLEANEVYTLACENLNFPARVSFKTYDDHRMAMAFAPLSLLIAEVEIEDLHVVEKSYPDFWLDLQKAGFTVKEI
ncbi:3-phosphoshikimate 1-carboxyvinyltransferase [Pedobacter sp. CG_S7]|uniref:3-phosphoshikimate 1-carboxyvinyltransferase n=1 Tax=Pedobacter sp. CG_S7 TaxID=3143930 RepID=UPI0033968F50